MKKYKTDIRVRIDSVAIEQAGCPSRNVLAERIARALEHLGLNNERGLEITVIERDGTLQGKRIRIVVPKHRR